MLQQKKKDIDEVVKAIDELIAIRIEMAVEKRNCNYIHYLKAKEEKYDPTLVKLKKELSAVISEIGID